MASFYLDHNFPIQVAAELQQLGHQATTARDLGAESEPDYQQLLTAVQHAWILVTHNWKDFRLLHGAWMLWSQAWAVQAHHTGVLVLAQAQNASQRAEYALRLHEFVEGHPPPPHNRLYRYRPARGWDDWS